jgi:hypothetical protein
MQAVPDMKEREVAFAAEHSILLVTLCEDDQVTMQATNDRVRAVLNLTSVAHQAVH